MAEIPRSANGRIELYGTSIIDAVVEKIQKPTIQFTKGVYYSGLALTTAGLIALNIESPTMLSTQKEIEEKTRMHSQDKSGFLVSAGITATGVAWMVGAMGLEAKRRRLSSNSGSSKGEFLLR